MVKSYLPGPLQSTEWSQLGEMSSGFYSKVQIEQTTWDSCPVDIPQGWIFTTSLGSLFQCWSPLRWKELSAYYGGISLFFWSMEGAWKILAQISLHPTMFVFLSFQETVPISRHSKDHSVAFQEHYPPLSTLRWLEFSPTISASLADPLGSPLGTGTAAIPKESASIHGSTAARQAKAPHFWNQSSAAVHRFPVPLVCSLHCMHLCAGIWDVPLSPLLSQGKHHNPPSQAVSPSCVSSSITPEARLALFCSLNQEPCFLSLSKMCKPSKLMSCMRYFGGGC